MAAGSSTTLSLTPRERLLGALRHQPIDRVPVWLMRQAGRYLPEYHEVRKNYAFLDLCKTPKAAAEVSIQPIEIIGSDAVIVFNDILLPLEPAGAKVDFDENGPRIDNPVRTEADLAALTTGKITSDEPIVGTLQTVRERVGPDFPVLGFIGSPWTLASYWVEGKMTRNFEHILKLRWGAPETLDRLLEHITQYATEYLKIQIEAGADAVQIFDTWGSALGQSDYSRFSGKWIAKIIEAVKPLGAPVIVYVNGGAPYLSELDKLGADCVSVDWRIDLSTAREALNSKISLQGNLDPLCLYAGPEATEAAVRNIFEKFPAKTGHVFNLGHGILPRTPVESAKRLIEAVKTHGAC